MAREWAEEDPCVRSFVRAAAVAGWGCCARVVLGEDGAGVQVGCWWLQGGLETEGLEAGC